MSDFLIIYLTAILVGGLAIPLGFLLEQPALGIYAATVLGSITGMLVVAFAGSGIRSWLNRNAESHENAQERVERLLGKWGVKGLGLFGPTFPGVTVSMIMALTAGVERREIIGWMSIGIAGLLAVYTVGLALLIELTGV